MKLIRYNYPTTSNTLSEFDQLFERAFRNFHNRLSDAAFYNPTAARPAADLYEDAENVYVRFEVPGAERKHLNVEFESPVLTVTYEKKNDKEEVEESFRRSVTVPEGLNADKVSAKYENGVLTVTLAKEEARRPRTIKVK